MALQDKLMGDLKEAMKRGDKVRQSVIRLIRARVKNAEIEQGASLDDAGVLRVLAKEVRQHRESITAFSKGERPDLVTKEEAELAILLEYLPEQMSHQEIMAAARQLIEELAARGPADKGKVMSKLMAQLRGKADGREVNAVVSELLTGS